ncbi:MAG: T9SS type A sorting domain-containing protein [Janthinobacterium lividum]
MQTSTLRTWLLGLLVLLAGTGPAAAQRVAASQSFTLSIHPDGTLWAWGQNNGGQLGLGNATATYQLAPQQVGTAANWASVSAGYNHVVAVRTDGTLWAWGTNTFGQLGLGTSSSVQRTPTQVGSASNWLSASAGYSCTLAVRADGTLWAWGYNGSGQLGLGAASTTSQPAPTQVGTATTWQRVSAGNGHTLALQTDGSLWAWGDNYVGQLGLGTTTSPTGPTRVGTATWVSAEAGPSYSLAVRQDGTLWAWGTNNQGQLGTGTTANQLAPSQVGTATTWQSVAPGNGFALARRQDGTLWSWGYNRWGQLGRGTTIAQTQTIPAQVGTATTWTGLSAGAAHAAALRQDGTLWTWGGNFLGQLGTGTGGPQLLPGQLPSTPPWSSLGVGTDHLLGIRTDGSLRAWGANYSSQLGDGTTTDQDLPITVGTSAWQSVASGSSVTLGIRPDGSLWAWGDNYYGQLGTGAALTYTTSTPVRVGTATTWRSVVVSVGQVLALQTDGSLWAWGDNNFGQLGTGSSPAVTVPVRVGTATWLSIGAGWMHSVGVRADGTLWTWGTNNLGQLGMGSPSPAPTFVPTQVGTSTAWRSVSAGVFYTLALKADGTLWAWGHNNYGELGVGSIATDVLAPTQVGTATTWRSVSAASYTSLALRQDNTLWVWGANYYGQLGLGTTNDQLTPVQQGTATWQSAGLGVEYGAGIRQDGSLWTWGYNERGQLGTGLPGSATPVFIANGGAPLAALAAGTAAAWHLAPNPAHDRVQLLGLPAGPVAGQLFDAQGRLARTTQAPELDLRGLAPGLYLLRATAGATTRTMRLVVE